MTKLNPAPGATQTTTTLDEPRFSAEQCETLFAAVLAHDAIDLNATLPDAIHLDYSPEQLTQCYRICRQVWKDGVDRKALAGIVEKISRHRALSTEDQLLFKHVRAKFKHLRFAYVVCDERHRYPRIFHLLVGIMGNLQDAFKNGQDAAVRRAAILARVLLASFPYQWIAREVDRFHPSTTAAFQSYVRGQIHFVRVHLAGKAITGKEFHEMRKVISRQVALYDNLSILFPSPYHGRVLRYLSTINGLMGALHDELIVKRFEKTQDYHVDTFEIPEAIRQRLLALTTSYRTL